MVGTFNQSVPEMAIDITTKWKIVPEMEINGNQYSICSMAINRFLKWPLNKRKVPRIGVLGLRTSPWKIWAACCGSRDEVRRGLVSQKWEEFRNPLPFGNLTAIENGS